MRKSLLAFTVCIMAIFGASVIGAGTSCKKAADNPAGSGGGSGSGTTGVAPGDADLKSITATSTLSDKGTTHAVANLMDGGNGSWCEAKQGDGLGESFTLTFSEAVTLKTFRVRNGMGDGKLYSANNRVKKLLVNGVKVKLSDDAGFQTVTLPTAVTGESIKFEIGSVHQGAKYRVTCLNEIAIEGVKGPAPSTNPADKPDSPPTTGDVKDPAQDPKKKDPAPGVPGKNIPPPPPPGN